MRKPLPYEPVLSGKASACLVELPRSAQRKVIGEWHVSFWADHAAKEFRIVEITEV